MGIFSRARDIISANVSALLDKAEDPEKLVGLMVREMEDTLVELKASCAGAMATRRKIEHELENTRARVEVWADKARLAVEKDRDDLAREALAQKARYVDRGASMEQELVQCDDVIGQYQGDIVQLEDKLKTVLEKQRVLIERHTHAVRKQRAQVNIRRVDTSDALARFDAFEHRIDRMEADAGLVNFGREPSLEQRFDALLEQDEAIEAELASLKADVRSS
jgi:phage shock protein A